ncbi:aminotransferase class I/II-fold pyridoxal phosphate-dependent enzyme [Roseomonas sp. E05]|uniref:aminotransferase class I/II-fold pyridoxal phosphate-dependent enzyme n=1 Tax=Roseomonas sp. E05 TaxID=3046310 RepID=UPI0024B9870D|nr:aminotransferase class I/II-fold pyridoxal phosphate-dependent enzyme [Roseomonas sp. E05]MDJ0386549.1 aminotransferase class I/II-fold pyridoxal phosphate-dependent enzyme [Roseomonas sp. E05]
MYDLWVNYPAVPAQQAAVAEALRGLAADPEALPAGFGPPPGDPRSRAALAPLLGMAPGQDLALTCGGQSALSVALLAALGATSPARRRVAVEAYTFPMARNFFRMEGIPTLGLPVDAEGLQTDALERALASADPPGVLYLMPVLHNPLGLTYSAARLQRIAAIARCHGLWVVEDEAYAFLAAPEQRPPTLASLIPERTLVMWSLSKILSLSLRLGALSHPPALADAVAEQVRIRGLTANPVVAAAAAAMATDGCAARIVAEKRAEGERRRAMARDILGTRRFAADPGASWHIWMRRPEGETEADFLARARAAGVSIAPAKHFHHLDREAPLFRLSLGGEADPARLEAGLRILAEVLGE